MIAAVVVLYPSPKRHEAPVSVAPPQVTAKERSVRLRPAERRAIDATLDRFVPAAVARRDPSAARELATPELRAGATSAQWEKGEIPVYPYDARGTKFHGWRVNVAHPGYVNVDLMLMSRHPRRQGSIIFKVELERVDGRWLVASFQPAAAFSAVGQRPQVTASNDFGPNPAANTAGEARLSPVWFAVPAAIGSLIVLVPLFILVRGWFSARRYRSSSGGLPPLPESLRSRLHSPDQ